MRRPYQPALLLLVLVAFLTSPTGLGAARKESRIVVVASIAPLADFVRQVGGDRVEVVLLLPPGASPHTYEPTPRAVQEISRAALFVKIGAGLEFWADRVVGAVAKGVRVVEASQGVDLIRSVHDGHDHGRGVDPHIWLDPVISAAIVGKIAEALASTDPANSAVYRKNSADYQERLYSLHKEIAGRVKTFRSREYVTFHPAWSYFSRRYGLRVAGVIEEAPGKEPSPRHLARILAELRRFETRVVFAEPQFNARVAEAIAKEAGGTVLFLDPVGGQKGRETYIDLMRHNLAVMEGALR